MRTLAILNRSYLELKNQDMFKECVSNAKKKEETSSSPTHIIINHCFIEIQVPHI